MAVIETQGLTRYFGNQAAVNGLDLVVEQGEVFGILGHNGAGKTTTVRLLNGILEPDAGTMRVLGLSPLEDGPALRAQTGVLTETPSLDERLSANDNLSIYADLYNVPRGEVQQRVTEMLQIFDLNDRGGDKVGGFSKGMKQRLALARAFLHQPALLFLDEPTSGLDPISTRHVHEMINHISSEEGRTVVLATHNLTEAQRLCTRVAVMEHGKLVAVGTPAQLAREIGGGLTYRVEIDPAQHSAAVETLAQINSVLRATVQEQAVVAAVQDREAIPDALSALISAGIRVYSVSPQEISLEDIYFAIHDQMAN